MLSRKWLLYLVYVVQEVSALPGLCCPGSGCSTWFMFSRKWLLYLVYVVQEVAALHEEDVVHVGPRG